MTANDLITEFESIGIRLWDDGDKLRYRAPSGAMTDERRAALADRKEDVLAALRETNAPLLAEPDHEHDPFPLTDVQQAYLLGRTGAFSYGSQACQVYTEISYSQLDPARVEAAWNRLIARHGMLRATMHADGYQQVAASVPHYDLHHLDLRERAPDRVEALVAAIRREMDHKVYDPAEWPLFELRLTRTPERDLLHLSMDFLVADYVSIQVLLGELAALHEDPDAELPALDVSFRDYVAASLRRRDTSRYRRDRTYWLDRVEDLPAAPELPVGTGATSSNGSDQHRGRGRFRRCSAELDETSWASLRSRATSRGVTPSAAVLAAFAEVIECWSATSRFTLNLTLLNRLPLHPDVGHLVGDFTSVSLLAVDRAAGADFQQRAQAIHSQVLEDMDHREFSGVEVIRQLARLRGPDAALMPVVFTSTIGLTGDTAESPDEGRLVHSLSQTPQVWIDCQVIDDRDRLSLSWDVPEGLFPDGVVPAMFAAFEALLRDLAGDDAAWSAARAVTLPAEQGRRRDGVNDTAVPLPAVPLHHGFFAQAAATPDRTAVITSDRVLTYGGLARHACAVAGELGAIGLAAGSIVAVSMDKGWEQVAAVLGVLHAGCAYLPVDTSQPPRRRRQILDDAGAGAVLTQSWVETPAGDAAGDDAVESPDEDRKWEILAVDQLEPTARTTPPATVHPDDLAYVITTSGSTGTPKGVMISHRAALNTIVDIDRRFDIGPGDTVLGLASLGFDLSVYDIFGPLNAGGTLVLPSADRRNDPSHWAEQVATHGVTVWNSVPAQMQMLCDVLPDGATALESLRVVMLSGDWIPTTLPDQVRPLAPGSRLVSLGGATEASIWSIFHPIGRVTRDQPSIPYGTPLANQAFDVVDTELLPRPEHVPGELVIKGAGLALGYLGDDTRTREQFVTLPTGERAYRTGDLGRYHPDGSIEFLGRQDRQVKIRGHRIELAEVEAAVLDHPGVRAVHVTVTRPRGSDARLVAFAEPTQTQPEPTEADLVRHRAEQCSVEQLAPVDTPQFVEFVSGLDHIAQLAMLDAFGSHGLFRSVDDRHSLAEILAAGVAEKHHLLIRRWLVALAKEGILTHHPDGTWSTTTVSDAATLARAWDAVNGTQLDDADYNPELVGYFRLSTEQLPSLMSDDVGALELLFPNGETGISEAAYRDNLISRYTNGLAAATLAQIAEHRSTPLRVLELGAGVGGASVDLIQALDGHGASYHFTDVSQFFLGEARERFGHLPWVTYGLLDMNADVRSQGYEPNSFDVIVSSHVLHYARHAGEVLARMREMLAPGGWLVFVDLTRESYQIMTSMMFLGGLTDFDDHRAGQDRTFITPGEWTDLLAAADGDVAFCLPSPEDLFARIGQHVFAAQFKADRSRLTPDDVRRHAGSVVPGHMVPSHVQIVDNFPLTTNAKVDTKTLASWIPDDEAERRHSLGEAPRTDLETRLAALWASVLGVEDVARDDDFFALGGDSLLAARLVGRMREELSEFGDVFWDSLVRQFLPEPTVAALARTLTENEGSSDGAGDDSAPTGQKPATEAAAETVGITWSVPASSTPAASPIILVPDAAGSLGGCRSLIEPLGQHGPVATLGSNPAALAALDPEVALMVTAADHADALAALPHESFHLVGVHSGGLLAAEVAQCLTELGRDVAAVTAVTSFPLPLCLDDPVLVELLYLLGMGLDPVTLGYPSEAETGKALTACMAAGLDRTPRVDRAAMAAAGGAHTEAFTRQLAELDRQDPGARAAAIGTQLEPQVTPDEVTAALRASAAGIAAASRHRPGTYTGDVTVIRHQLDTPIWPTMRDDMTRWWERICLGELRVVDLPGSHFDLVARDPEAVVTATLEANP